MEPHSSPYRLSVMGTFRFAIVVTWLLLLAGCAEPGSGSSAARDLPSPPSGTRWVGAEHVVVAVPEWWTTGETQCLAPVEDTVYFDIAATADCVDRPDPSVVREVSALALLDASGGYGELVVRDMQPVAEVDGHQILERASCEEWFEGVCRHMFAVPSESVVFAVTIADEGDGDYESIRESLMLLPDGWTTVPLATAQGWTPSWGAEPDVVDDLVSQLRKAGLAVAIETVEKPADAAGDYATFPAGSLLEVSPALGSPIEEGGTVTLSVSGESLAPVQ